MTTDLEKIAKIVEFLEKQAFVGSIVGAAAGTLARGAGGAALMAVKNPAMAFNAVDSASSALRVSQQAGEARVQAAENIQNPSGPTF